jgi:O-antigen ligase
MFVAPALVLIAVGRWLFTGAPVGRGWRPASLLLVAYGAVCIGSLLFAADPERTGEALMNYLDGIVIVLVMTLYLRTWVDFDRTLWALLLAGTALATLAVLQQVTGSYESAFAGLSRTGLRNIYDEAAGYRSEGPVSANYFALILVVMVPLAVDRLLRDGRPAVRALCTWTLVSVVASIVFTYSRGGFVALAAVCLPMLLWVPRRYVGRTALALAIGGVVVVAALAPTKYGQRLAALGQVAGVMSGQAPEDGALRGRVSEMTSAAMMFADNPLIGVGYGNFEEHYPRYARHLALDGRREERQAHSLYLEVAAETGLIGVAVFASLLLFGLAGVRRAHGLMEDEARTRDAQRVLAFGFAFFGYLAGSLFLHLSYPRYFWLLFGISLALGALAPAHAAAPATLRREATA